MKEPCGLKILKAFFTLGYPFKLLENEIYDRTYISEVRTKHRLNSEPVTKILKNVRSSTGRFKRRASHAWCWEGRHNPQLNITSQNFTAFRRFGRLKIVSLNNIESLFCEDWGCYHGLLTTKAKQIWLAFLPAPNVYFASLAMDCGYRLMFNTISCLNSLYLPNVDEKRKEYSLNTKRCPWYYFLPRKMKRFPFVMVSVTSHYFSSKCQSIPICLMWLDNSTKSPP